MYKLYNSCKNKNHLFAIQKPPFCNTKTYFLHAKNHLFALQLINENEEISKLV